MRALLSCLSLSLLVACSMDPMAKSAASHADATSGDGSVGDGLGSVPACPPKLAGCFGKERFVCNEAGTAFVKTVCDPGKFCENGECVECVADSDCKPGNSCKSGACVVTPLTVTTTELPPGLVGQPYSATLAATGGVPPLQWSLAQGALPAGILLDASGKLAGSATVQGVASVQVQVQDAQGAKATAILVLEIKDAGLVITTTTLKPVTEGKAMAPVQLTAQGGKTPYFWGIISGKLPQGVTLDSAGNLSGTPTEDGDFPFDVKVLDNGSPTLTATRSFTLTVKLAPLEIIGKQEINLLITKIIVLPLIVVVDKVPVPYSTKLEAQGGKKPYHWKEQPLPGFVSSFIPKSGLPKGLTLADDGTVSGAVTDASLVVDVQVPLTQISLKGFFFAAQVTDSLSPAQTKTALYIVPTVPVGP
jgi:hypothetical protein